MTNRLTPERVAEHAYAAGFRGERLVTSVAVSAAETGGTFDADLDSPPNHTTGPDNGSIDRGLWQINSYWHPEVSDAEAHNPAAAARAAYSISKGGSSWRAWSTYNSGAYKKYLGEARAASAKASGGSLSTGGEGPPAAFLGPDTDPALDVRIGGQQATSALGYYLVGGSVSFTTQEASQLDLVFDDNDYELLDRFALLAGPDGTVIETLGMRWRIQSIGTEAGAKGPATRLTCQPSGVMRMRGFTPEAARNLSPTDFMAMHAGTAGLRFRGEQSAKRPSVGPQKVNDPVTGEKRSEYAWEVGQRLAQELGFLAYESGGVYHFGSPQELAEIAKTWQLSVRGFTIGDPDEYAGTVRPFGWPSVRNTRQHPDRTPSRSLDVTLRREDIEKMRGGEEILVTGIPALDNIPTMTITSVSWDLTDAISPGRLQAVDRSRFYTKYASGADRRASDPVVSNDSGDLPGVAHAGTKSALDFVTFCLNQTGDHYVWGAGRDTSDPNPDAFDCSGLVFWAAAQVGVKIPSTSQTQWAYCQSHGTAISVQAAASTRGALLFEAGSDGTPDAPGHVAVSLGDGQHTIEARGSAYLVRKQPIVGRPWSHAAKIPGMRYG